MEFVFHGGHSPYTRLNAPEDCIAGKFYEKLRTQAVCAHSYAIVYHETAKNKRAAKGLLVKNRLRFASSPAGADAPHREPGAANTTDLNDPIP